MFNRYYSCLTDICLSVAMRVPDCGVERQGGPGDQGDLVAPPRQPGGERAPHLLLSHIIQRWPHPANEYV